MSKPKQRAKPPYEERRFTLIFHYCPEMALIDLVHLLRKKGLVATPPIVIPVPATQRTIIEGLYAPHKTQRDVTPVVKDWVRRRSRKDSIVIFDQLVDR
ncbi:MAG TPA: hypothetical protein VF597_02935 [Candidatus Saccharimonadales bacterium]|jgi:hypothetical protein